MSINVPDPRTDRATDPASTHAGLNRIVVKTVQYGLQAMLLDKDVPVRLRDGHTLYANVFRPEDGGRGTAQLPVLISADIYGKDSIHLVYPIATRSRSRWAPTTPRRSAPGSRPIRATGCRTAMSS